MSVQYSRDLMKVSVAKILQTIGWHTIHTTPIEILIDLLIQYITQLAKSTNEYANYFGCVDSSLDHLGLAFRDSHINLNDLQEYVTYVDFNQEPSPIPKYPIPKEDHLNFLKPGSKECVTRPVYIHEHLPPMYPLLEASETNNEVKVIKEEPDEEPVENSSPVFKRPIEVSSGESFKRPRVILEEEGRPTREISSVMMTTSGFLSPAREGKLPESRTPLATIDTTTPLNTPPSQNEANRKMNRSIRRIDKKSEKPGRALFKPTLEDKLQKIITKDIVKFTKVKSANLNLPVSVNSFMLNNDVKISPILNNKLLLPSGTKINKALAAARLKTEKLNTTITPIVPKPVVPSDNIDKLFTEPDKKKINIFKKISNVKNDKLESKIIKIKEEIKQESRESSPDLIIDESAEILNKVHHISNDITIELIDSVPNVNKSSEKPERLYFDDDSPPGTPSTPKTPEMISHSPLLAKEKRKRKDKSKIKKVQRQPSPPKLATDAVEMELERPKTPEAAVIPKQEPPPVTPSLPFPFFPGFAGPGLIPPPLNNTLFPHLPLTSLGLHGFGQPPYMPVHPGMSLNFLQPPKIEEPQSKPTIIERPIPPVPAVEKEILSPKPEKKSKEHKKEKKDKLKKKNKKDKVKSKAEKKKLKEEKKDKVKKEKREKRKEKEQREGGEISIPKLTLKLGSASPRPETPDTRKLNIKPIVKKEEQEEIKIATEMKREMSPELAKISALVTGQPKPKSTTAPLIIKEEQSKEEVNPVPVAPQTRTGAGPGRPRIHPIKPKPTKPSKQQTPVKDSEGNEVWICPACGRQDDGSPMIGCDDCDAWYHWVCVGIQVPPDDSEDWYCRICIVKKQEVLQTDKKKKRKKREKKEH